VKSTVDLGRLARGIVDRLRREDPQRDVEFVIREPLIAIGDETLLVILLENLLSNAWKFTGRTPRAAAFGASRNTGLLLKNTSI